MFCFGWSIHILSLPYVLFLYIAVSDYKLERIESYKLLGVHINEYLKWDDHIKHAHGIRILRHSIKWILRKLKDLAKYEFRKQLAEKLICQNYIMPIWFFTLYYNSYLAVCNGFSLLLHVLYSVTMLRTFGMYLKSDDFQSVREEI